ncbi:RNA-guided endonuclease TnpB family protein [Thermoanaerobacter brockii subsp. lactiethylicus]|jgi:putative transposase|uniref:Transposase, IS605 OrfB family n=2 Tax=Thermoanaerobacter TaxID=1754 RepID=B0KB89_THEP3|nr:MULTISPECIES: RNA-guided endonuclease TnpB family protein [Thermoanaerobacter]MBZ4656739.1 transposase, OrfB family [Thermoanaerobacter sp.]ABY93551.1 transposase, IS605 OrfB family [Thermoanaerobacter sp. X514]ABY95277.1 transposase, IS605 OrfB family [Thermoanaerobacter pseudethanolicus ATCC 33223]ADV80223.1 transposase, IS605 OrfB family [Thermoanaerobacter brockii subsp. finnii Ako-1]HAA80381.1 transposase [Thermoanaerobacter sp.]
MEKVVKRAEQIQINRNHEMWKYFDKICFATKNLYNYANYIIRQEFINNNKWIRYRQLNRELKNHETYKNLPAQTAQHTLKLLDRNWKSFFKAIKEWEKDKSKFSGRPRLPKYKKKNGRAIAIFTNQQCKIKSGYLTFPKTNLRLKTMVEGNLKEVRVIPKGNIYIVEIVYERVLINKTFKKPQRIAGIDLGLDNFVTLTNNIGIKPIVINGKVIKSINQYYNKKKAELMSYVGSKGTSRRIEKLTLKRNNKIKDFMHKASKFIVNWCKEHDIDTIVIGYNKGWKQEIELGKVNNQNFVGIPYYQFINMLQYKCEEEGINLILVEEGYTSGCSFLDSEEVCKENYNPKRRITRGLFKSNKGILINADVNAAYNIMVKVFPNAFAEGIEGVGLHPVRQNVA